MRRDSQKRYVTVWEFHVRPSREQEFERVYGPEGEWVQLFRQGQGYIRTQFYRDAGNRQRYLTLDIWASEPAYRKFRDEHAEEYRAIDQRCQELTEKETCLGAFQMITSESDSETETEKPSRDEPER